MTTITVVTSTIGRESLLRLSASLSVQGVKTVHIILWDTKRVTGGVTPHDIRLQQNVNDNYSIFHYFVEHEIRLKLNERVDNHLRAIGISMSTSDYITLIDDDCWVEPGWFRRAFESHGDYSLCQRFIWEDLKTRLGVDTYESIGHTNTFGYKLMDMNTIVFRSDMKGFLVSEILNNNNYTIDRHLAEKLSQGFQGTQFSVPFMNQVSPDFLLEFHKRHITERH